MTEANIRPKPNNELQGPNNKLPLRDELRETFRMHSSSTTIPTEVRTRRRAEVVLRAFNETEAKVERVVIVSPLGYIAYATFRQQHNMRYVPSFHDELRQVNPEAEKIVREKADLVLEASKVEIQMLAIHAILTADDRLRQSLEESERKEVEKEKEVGVLAYLQAAPQDLWGLSKKTDGATYLTLRKQEHVNFAERLRGQVSRPQYKVSPDVNSTPLDIADLERRYKQYAASPSVEGETAAQIYAILFKKKFVKPTKADVFVASPIPQTMDIDKETQTDAEEELQDPFSQFKRRIAEQDRLLRENKDGKGRMGRGEINHTKYLEIWHWLKEASKETTSWEIVEGNYRGESYLVINDSSGDSKNTVRTELDVSYLTDLAAKAKGKKTNVGTDLLALLNESIKRAKEL